MKSGYGNRIKEIRDKNGLSREEFGKKLGLTYDQVRKIESEDRKPSDDIKVKICEEFRVSADFILMGYDFIMPQHPLSLNMNMHTLMAQEAIGHLGKAAQSIKKLDVVAHVGMEQLSKIEDEIIGLEVDAELEQALKIVKDQRRMSH